MKKVAVISGILCLLFGVWLAIGLIGRKSTTLEVLSKDDRCKLVITASNAHVFNRRFGYVFTDSLPHWVVSDIRVSIDGKPHEVPNAVARKFADPQSIHDVRWSTDQDRVRVSISGGNGAGASNVILTFHEHDLVEAKSDSVASDEWRMLYQR